MPPRPLEGIRVLDLTLALAGPYGALLLGGLGAEIIHIEAPGKGEIARTNPPFVGPRGLSMDPPKADEISLTILNRARNKRSVTLDLKNPKGREIFFRLAEQADVVFENMSDGTADRLGVGYAATSRANPRIVYASITAFGDPSSFPTLKGMDILVQAVSGLMEATGFPDGPPTRIGIPIADLVTPLFAVNGLLAALIQRGRTGEGQHVKVSMLDCLVSMVAEEHFDVLGSPGGSPRSGNSFDRLAPFGIFPCVDGHIAIVAFRTDWLGSLLDVIGHAELVDDPRFSSRGPRTTHAGVLNQLIEAWTRTQTTEVVVRELFERRGVPAARVRTPIEALRDPGSTGRGAVMRLEHPALGDLHAFGMGNPIQFSRAHAQFDQPAEPLGASTDEVLTTMLNLSAQELSDLRRDRVI